MSKENKRTALTLRTRKIREQQEGQDQYKRYIKSKEKQETIKRYIK